MPKRSAGILLHRLVSGEAEVLLVHPGGPFWKNKDDGAWSIPKGEYGESRDPLAVAKREFAEELGAHCAPWAIYRSARRSASVRGGKIVTAFAIAGDFDPSRLATSNMFEIEWPPQERASGLPFRKSTMRSGFHSPRCASKLSRASSPSSSDAFRKSLDIYSYRAICVSVLSGGVDREPSLFGKGGRVV